MEIAFSRRSPSESDLHNWPRMNDLASAHTGEYPPYATCCVAVVGSEVWWGLSSRWATSCHPSTRRMRIRPLSSKPNSQSSAACALGKGPWVLAWRRNSPWRRFCQGLRDSGLRKAISTSYPPDQNRTFESFCRRMKNLPASYGKSSS